VADTPTIKFKGKEYEVAPFDSWTLDEALVLYSYAKLTFDQIDDTMGFHPGVIMALIHVSVKRKDPRAPEKSLRAAIGALKMTELEEVFEGISVEDEEEGDAEVPPADPPPPSGGDSSSGTVTPLTRSGTGHGSETSSDAPPEPSQPDSSGGRSSDAAVSA
jgi:hypothetical protein